MSTSEAGAHSCARTAEEGGKTVGLIPVRPWRRYWLRMLAAFVVLGALPAWWLWSEIRALALENEMIVALRGAGAEISTAPAQPQWFWRCVPEALAPHRERAVAAESGVREQPIAGTELWLIGRLKHLKQLAVRDSTIGDDDLAACRGLTQLERLRLTGCPNLTDAALRHFAAARGIRSLDMSGTAAGDGCLETISTFGPLDELRLSETRVTDSSVPRIGQFTSLQSLALPRGVTSRGLQDIASLDRLTRVDVWVHCREDVAALRAVCSLPRLTHLTIRGDGLTDAGLELVSGATGLEELSILGGYTIGPALVGLKKLPKLRQLSLGVDVVTPPPPMPKGDASGPPAEIDQRGLDEAWAQEQLARTLAPVGLCIVPLFKGNGGVELRLDGVATLDDAASAEPEMTPDEAIAEIKRLGGAGQLKIQRGGRFGQGPPWRSPDAVTEAFRRGATPPPPQPESPKAVTSAHVIGSKNFAERVRLLKYIPTLESVTLEAAATTDASLEALCSLPNLRYLGLNGADVMQVTDHGMEHLSRIRTLTHLELAADEVTEQGLAALAKLTRLERLRLRGAGITDAALPKLETLRRLKWLALWTPAVTDAGLEVLTRLPNIEHLSLSSRGITDAAFAHFATLPNLRRLVLNDTRLCGSGLGQIVPGRDLTKLYELKLNGPETCDGAPQYLKNVPNLQILGLEGRHVTDAGLTQLASLEHLRELTLCRTGVTDGGLCQLAKLEQLTELSLDGTAVTDAGLDELAALKHLEKLDLMRTAVTEACVEKLKRLTSLERVALPREISDAAVAELRRAKIDTLGR